MTEKPTRLARPAFLLLIGCLLALASRALAEDVVFRHVFDGSPLDVKAKPGETFTPAVVEFHQTGKNPNNDKPEALAEGKRLYVLNCQSCHLPNGQGGMGASLVSDKHVYPQVKEDPGLFAVVFGGASGAMQPFSKRLNQDEILKIMAYVRNQFIKP
jgi:cytochrome c-L